MLILFLPEGSSIKLPPGYDHESPIRVKTSLMLEACRAI